MLQKVSSYVLLLTGTFLVPTWDQICLESSRSWLGLSFPAHFIVVASINGSACFWSHFQEFKLLNAVGEFQTFQTSGS